MARFCCWVELLTVADGRLLLGGILLGKGRVTVGAVTIADEFDEVRGGTGREDGRSREDGGGGGGGGVSESESESSVKSMKTSLLFVDAAAAVAVAVTPDDAVVEFVFSLSSLIY